jgi:hypothetical protein
MWWSREGHVITSNRKEVDSDATAALMKQLPLHRRQYVTKVVSKNCRVGTTLQAWSFQETAECPRCNHKQENTLHVQRCNGHEAEKVFLQSVSMVDNYPTETQTRPDLHEVIMYCIQLWRNKLSIKLDNFQTDLHKVIRKQHKIGWLNLLEGFPAKG